MTVISLNGVDGSGKTHQQKLLGLTSSKVHLTQPLITYSDRWPKLKGLQMSEWWFREVSVDELVDIMIDSLKARDRDTRPNKVCVHDRGWRMFKAVGVATLMTREEVSLVEACKRVDEAFSQKLGTPAPELEILLRPNEEYFLKVQRITDLLRKEDAGFPESAKERYSRYQVNLRQAIKVYFLKSSAIDVLSDAPTLEVQNRIRDIVSDETSVNLPRVGENFTLAVGLGGLSECGKSSLAQSLADRAGFVRLKLRYFLQELQEKGIPSSPEQVALEVIKFLEAHPHIKRITFESLHDPYVPAALKAMLGERCRIVFIHADEEVRVSRNAKELGISADESRTLVEEKDKIKINRGCLKVREIADVVLDNNRESPTFEPFPSFLLGEGVKA